MSIGKVSAVLLLESIFLGSMLTCGGCLVISVQKTEPSVVYVPAPTTAPAAATDLAMRFSAASQIASVSARDESMSRLALDAAAAGQIDMTHQALQAIASVSTRDNTAQHAAGILAQRGMRNEAIAVAQSIASVSQRDETLATLSAR